jgi:SPP1 family predicted phage head-tail adaptor
VDVMRAGDLNKRGIIQYIARSKNSFNEDIETWTDLDTVWCSIEPVSGSERWLQQERVSEATYKIRMRYRANINPTMRLKNKNRYLQFLAVLNLEENSKEIFIPAKEVI